MITLELDDTDVSALAWAVDHEFSMLEFILWRRPFPKRRVGACAELGKQQQCVTY
jgi:hypothetical protein